MADNGLTLHYLTTWRDVLAEATAQGRFDQSTLGAVADYLESPKEWSQDNGGK